ncbi:MAG: fibrobacter succinogenes major paralogous domain-containing protein [Candidatus Marinimicrobia bacterium]|nr:fibrobacter succinogenes major paralogous domain-containing protein [Candidatus Neomarinimicrobiota bacterium]
MKRNAFFVLCLAAILPLLFLCCEKPALSRKSAKIGTQTWMTKNLNVTRFRNGDPIPVCKDFAEWKRLGDAAMPACAAYDFDLSKRKEYGLLYNWYAVSDPRGLAPEGFRIPVVEDFMTLLSFAGGSEPYDPGRAANALSRGGSSGFDAPFGGWGCREPDPQFGITAFAELGRNAAYWTSTENGATASWNLDIGSTLRSDTEGAYLDGSSSKTLLFSVRCVTITPEP